MVFMGPQWMIVQWVWDNEAERAETDAGCYHPYCYCDDETDAENIITALSTLWPHASPGGIDA